MLRLLLPALIVAVLSFGILVLAPGQPAPVYACSGGSIHLEYYVDRTEYVAVVDPVVVGGPENTAPTVAPPATLHATPPITATPDNFDLTGLGATLGVVQGLYGSPPAQFDIDERGREQTEEQLRQMEADPGFIFPCPPGFLVPRYEMGQQYLVVAGYWEDDPRLQTLLKYRVEGDQVLIGGGNDDYGWQLLLTRQTLDTYFPDTPFESFGAAEDGVEIVRLDVGVCAAVAVSRGRPGRVCRGLAHAPASHRRIRDTRGAGRHRGYLAAGYRRRRFTLRLRRASLTSYTSR